MNAINVLGCIYIIVFSFYGIRTTWVKVTLITLAMLMLTGIAFLELIKKHK